MRSVAYLGKIISSEGVEVESKKTEAVKNWPRPLTQTDIRSFFGYRGLLWEVRGWFFVSCISLDYFDSKEMKFEWSDACERNFQNLER